MTKNPTEINLTKKHHKAKAKTGKKQVKKMDNERETGNNAIKKKKVQKKIREQ